MCCIHTVVKEVGSLWGLGQLIGVSHKRTNTKVTCTDYRDKHEDSGRMQLSQIVKLQLILIAIVHVRRECS